jgi:beta-glucosidase
MAISFPDNFLWGTATAAHQVEGGNWNNDWWVWEHTLGSGCAEPSGDACDHFWRYPQDIALLADLGFGAYRFSLEWSRIEPAEGEFSRNALDHYRRMIDACHENDVVPVVTYHHFTSPIWASLAGGWEVPESADRFARFCEVAAGHLGDVVGIHCTLNEPNVVALMGHYLGVFPPGKRDEGAMEKAIYNLIQAHRLGYEAIKAGPGRAPVGMTLSMHEFAVEPGGEAQMARARDRMEDVWLEECRGDDYVGVQTYTRLRFGPDGILGPAEGVPALQMGYEYWPQALETTIRRASDVTGAPVLVTENGIGTADDDQRAQYVTEALHGVRHCLDDGIDVRGYFYWSLLDNFEWALGYRPTFGLVAVDRETQARAVKPSARWLGDIARRNRLEGSQA